MPNIIKKLPKYKGFLTIEYKPFVFKLSAICLLTFLPEVPAGVCPTTKILINNPKN